MGLGGPTPTTFATGYMYAGMGYTTVNEAAVPVLSAKHTHEELRDTPIVDKACLLLMANNEILLDLIEAGELERARHVVAWLIWAAKAYGVKAVNPGGVAAWKWGKDAKGLNEPVEGYSKTTPAKIIASLARIVDELGLPHPLHLHCNNLGTPGNVATTIETMKMLEGSRAHMAHLQFHAYGGDDWATMRSEAAAIAEYFNAHPNLTADAGAVLFGNAVTITADGPWQHLLYQLTGRKWGNLDVENETGCGIVPYIYKRATWSTPCSGPWAWSCCCSSRIPGGSSSRPITPTAPCFWRYPEIIQLLMNADFRRERVKALPAKALKRIVLADLDRRVHAVRDRHHHVGGAGAGPRACPRRDTSGSGADADVAIYNENRTARACSAIRATSSRAERSWSRRARSAGRRGPGVRRAARLRREDRGVPAAAVPAVLHDVVRQLPGGDGAHRAADDAARLQADRSRHDHPHPQGEPTVPLEAEALSPDVMPTLSHDAVRALPVLLGKRQCRLDDFFEVEGEASDELEIRGDVGKVKWIGRGMTPGPPHHRRQRRHAPRRLHEGRGHRGDGQRLRLGRRRDVGGADPHCAATPAGRSARPTGEAPPA